MPDIVSRALKTKHDTPKYGLIYHASLVGQTAPKNKGRISRMLAAKASLCVRVDALGEEDTVSTIGVYVCVYCLPSPYVCVCVLCYR